MDYVFRRDTHDSLVPNHQRWYRSRGSALPAAPGARVAALPAEQPVLEAAPPAPGRAAAHLSLDKPPGLPGGPGT